MFITRDDGLIDRDQAAELAHVTPDAISVWATRGYTEETTGEDGQKTRVRRKLPVALYEGRKPLYRPADVIRAERATRKRGGRSFPRPAQPLAA